MNKSILAFLLIGFFSFQALANSDGQSEDDRAGLDMYTSVSLSKVASENQDVMDWIAGNYPGTPNLEKSIEMRYSSFGDIYKSNGPEGTDGVTISFSVSQYDAEQLAQVLDYNNKNQGHLFFVPKSYEGPSNHLAGLQEGRIVPVNASQFNVQGGVYEITLLKKQGYQVISTSPAFRVKLNRDSRKGKIGFTSIEK